MRNEPLGLPKGSIRALIAILVIVCALAQALWRGSISPEVGVLATAVMAKYFDARRNGHIKPEGDQK